jgi:hypothetical protein
MPRSAARASRWGQEIRVVTVSGTMSDVLSTVAHRPPRRRWGTGMRLTRISAPTRRYSSTSTPSSSTSDAGCQT